MDKYQGLYQDYYDKELYMVGALDCFGVPHTPDNINHKSYLDMIADDLKITSHLSDVDNPIFIYSCGQMNFHKYSKMRTNDLKQIVPELLFHSIENLNKTFEDMKDTIDYLITINPSIKIYIWSISNV
ncbi:MAG: hypothetical protein IJF92_03860 [Bacilli bacterium]|nr:hypothetical protein [Bacilli bacterium]